LADITSRVKFLGDASQLLQTYRAIGAQASLLDRQINAINRASLQIKGFAIQGPGITAARAFETYFGPGIRDVKTEFDSINKVLKTTGETFIQVGKQGKFLTGTFEEIHGNTDDILKATQAYSGALSTNAQALSATRQAYLSTTGPVNQRINLLKKQLALEVQQGIISKQTADSIIDRERRLRNYDRAPALQNYVKQKAQAFQALALARAEIDRAIAAPPTVGPASLQNIPKNILRELYARGLPRDPAAQFARGAEATVTGDLIHGTQRAAIQFRDMNGVLQQAQVEWDKNGKAITRFGGNLSGLQNLLNQTVRNLQKVVQWTAATTLVFGTLAFAASELSTLVNLDKSLKQLSITAQSTSEQTRGLFSNLADTAFETATPLAEMVKAADDIALATRKAGSTSKEYQQDILNLSQAVGIFTNLTGVDTVQATDLLTSAMKQLGIETEDVVGVLSKITAVAGGQSNAIADIAQVLAVMSEAARQAGLSIDETIATAQVLSQVTAKSPAEIATAFKNLTGSLDSTAGTKALAKFNIDLRDSAGNLRNILDIYGEISDKIRQGVIAPDQVKGLVKAIAGGPRRVPDAAALLSNIDQIEAVTLRSVSATNEALIANAKILDTTAAKLTQLKVIVDRFAFEKFGPALKDTVEVFLQAATSLVDVLNSVDAGAISTALTLAGMFLALRIGGGILARFVGGIFSMVESLNATRIAAVGAGQAVAQFGAKAAVAQQLAGARGGITPAGIKSGAASLIGYGAIGAGLTAATGGNPLQVVGGGLQGVGLAALAIPHPFAKAAAAAAILGGTFLQMATASNEAAQSVDNVAASAEEVLTAFAAYSEARDILENLGKTQKELSTSIENLTSKQNKSASDLALLNDFQSQYVQNTLAMADANVKLADAQQILNDKIGPGFQEAIAAATSGRLNPEQLQELIKEYQYAILRATRPDLTLPEEIDIPDVQRAGFLPYNLSPVDTAYVPTQTTQPLRLQQADVEAPVPLVDLHLDELEQDANKAKLLFNSLGTEIIASITPTGRAFDLIDGALQRLKASGDPAADAMIKTFNAFKQGKDAVNAAEVNLAIFQARIEALSAIGDPSAATLQKGLDLVTKIVNVGALEGGEKGADAIFQATKSFADLLKSGEAIKPEDFLPTVKLYAELSGATQGLTDKNIAYQAILDSLGLEYELLGERARVSLGQISEETAELIENLTELQGSLLEDYTLKRADLQARKQGGEFEGKEGEFAAQDKQLKALEEQIIRVTDAYINAEETIPGFETVVDEFAASLTNVVGLHDAEVLSTDQLIARLFSLADTYGLTGAQVDILGNKLVALADTARQIDAIKASFGISAEVDLSGAIKALQALRNSVSSMAKLPIIGNIIGGAGLGPIDNALQQLINAQSSIGGAGSSLGAVYTGGAGSGGPGGSAPTTKAPKGPGLDVSTIDIPDAIATAYNRDALIQEAIRRAKALQAKIPGAAKEASNDIVELLKGTQRILEVRGVKDDLLRRALEELADIEKKRLEFETKADTIRRIRVGSGSFAAIANVPVNTQTGVSLGGAQGPINISLNLNGTVLTPAQLAQFADLVAAALKRQIANG
jgi:TP901 family phage tail tape measure protein